MYNSNTNHNKGFKKKGKRRFSRGLLGKGFMEKGEKLTHCGVTDSGFEIYDIMCSEF